MLANCATPSVPPGPIEQPDPVAIDPRLCVDPPAEPRLPDEAGLPAPVTEEERAAVLAFILWNQSVLAVLRSLIDRAELAQAECLEERAADAG